MRMIIEGFNESEYYTVKRMSDVSGMSVSAIYNLIRDGKVKKLPVQGSSVLVSGTEVRKWLVEHVFKHGKVEFR